ncbi:MAG: 3-phosphoshikimate 1-carboxyvinyltransferase [Lachnospiraceae bacterium]|nr:3-phosphoshikimate 1-carboxyvinyltransferase [Lachnospiraceae bacterium]
MIATFNPSRLSGTIEAPPSKSMAHRYLIGAALAKERSILSGMDYSQDILASIDCLKALGTKIFIEKDKVTIEPYEFMRRTDSILECRESGSTLRFFLPLALCLNKPVTLKGSERLMERPLDIYEELCQEKGFDFYKDKESVTVCGNLESGKYELRGDVSSQFITGMIFALVHLGAESSIRVRPPFESRPYIHLTIAALNSFGAKVEFTDEFTIKIKPSCMHSFSGKIEGDYSNAAFLASFNHIGSDVHIENLNADSLQGDRVFQEYFRKISEGKPVLDISDCPDLGPVLIALASLKNGAVFTGTNRLKAKESDRGMAMQEELAKLGGGIIFGDNQIVVPKQELKYRGIPISGHNDHRIVMAMSVILSKIGGTLEGIEAVNKSYPGFFNDMKQLGAEVKIK